MRGTVGSAPSRRCLLQGCLDTPLLGLRVGRRQRVAEAEQEQWRRRKGIRGPPSHPMSPLVLSPFSSLDPYPEAQAGGFWPRAQVLEKNLEES